MDDFAIVPAPTTPTAPTLEGAPKYWRHRVFEDGVFTRKEKRGEGIEYIVELSDADREMWPELIGIARISFWQKKEGEEPLMLTVAIRGG